MGKLGSFQLRKVLFNGVVSWTKLFKKKSKKEKQEKNTCIPFFERTCIHLEISAKIENKLLEPWLEQDITTNWPMKGRIQGVAGKKADSHPCLPLLGNNHLILFLLLSSDLHRPPPVKLWVLICTETGFFRAGHFMNANTRPPAANALGAT